METLIKQLKAARKRGVNLAEVSAHFVKTEEALAMIPVKVAGLGGAVIWTYLGPLYLAEYKLRVAREHLDVILPEWLMFFTCAMGFVSMLAFGFDLVNLPALLRGSQPTPTIEPTDVSESGFHETYNGVVLPSTKDTVSFGNSEDWGE